MPTPMATAHDFLHDQQESLAQEIVRWQLTLSPHLAQRYGLEGRGMFVEDARYRLKSLAEAVRACEPTLFTDHVAWANKMLAARNICGRDLASELQAMLKVLEEHLPASVREPALAYVKSSIEDLVHEEINDPFLDSGQPLAALAQQYLNALLSYQRHVASDLILRAAENRVSIKEIYCHVFERCQYEIGRLWQSNIISIAQEHYCTASTQVIMSQLYPYIFRAERKLRGTIVAACVSGELHEIGARMLCDLLEMEGWNTIYLGANVPSEGIVAVLLDNHSDILAISASMVFHIPAVREVIAEVRLQSPKTRILVGGHAFKIAPNLWRDVGADYFSDNAVAAISLIAGLDRTLPGQVETTLGEVV